jgi:hypothetical protein
MIEPENTNNEIEIEMKIPEQEQSDKVVESEPVENSTNNETIDLNEIKAELDRIEALDKQKDICPDEKLKALEGLRIIC